MMSTSQSIICYWFYHLSILTKSSLNSSRVILPSPSTSSFFIILCWEATLDVSAIKRGPPKIIILTVSTSNRPCCLDPREASTSFRSIICEWVGWNIQWVLHLYWAFFEKIRLGSNNQTRFQDTICTFLLLKKSPCHRKVIPCCSWQSLTRPCSLLKCTQDSASYKEPATVAPVL